MLKDQKEIDDDVIECINMDVPIMFFGRLSDRIHHAINLQNMGVRGNIFVSAMAQYDARQQGTVSPAMN